MDKRKRELIKQLTPLLQNHEWSLEHSGRHPKLNVDGRVFALPCSPSDHRAFKNTLSDIRRALKCSGSSV